MIPPVEVRQVRPCTLIGGSTDCDCINVTWYAEQDPECKVKQRFFKARRDAEGRHEALSEYPCIYNITAEELKELIDQHNTDHRRLEEEIHKKLQDLYKAITNPDIGSYDAKYLLSAKIQMIEWVLHLDPFSIEEESRRMREKEAGHV